MRTISEIAIDLADAGRELGAQSDHLASLREQVAALEANVEASRARCLALDVELQEALQELRS